MAPRFTLMLVSAAAAALTLSGSTIPSGRAEAAQAKQQRGRTVRPATRWAQFLQTYIEGEFRANPAFAVNQGRHEYDGQLPDWSETGLNNERMRLRSAIATARTFANRSLTREQRFERDYLIAYARGQLFWLDIADQPHTNPAY